MSPLISIVIPVYNTEKYLAECIHSVLNQTYTPIEIICVNDGSTDTSGDVLQTFGDRIQIVTLEHNSGISVARNKGIEIAHGEFLTFLDADDLWEPTKLEDQQNYLQQNPELDICFSHMKCFLSPELPEETKMKRFCPPLAMPGIVATTMFLRTKDFLRVGEFNPQWKLGEFIDWFERAKELGLRSECTPDVFLRRRIHDTNTGIRDKSFRSDYLKVIKEVLDRKKKNTL